MSAAQISLAIVKPGQELLKNTDLLIAVSGKRAHRAFRHLLQGCLCFCKSVLIRNRGGDEHVINPKSVLLSHLVSFVVLVFCSVSGPNR
jgi:hypothetical protein